MCLIAEIIMLIGGVYALIAGKITITKEMKLEGTKARIAGLILLLPIIVAFSFGLVIGFLVGLGTIPEDALLLVSAVEVATVLGVLIGLFLYAKANSNAPQASDSPEPTLLDE